ncbi:MAG: TetR/AcrR family transcriptional regulator [Neisseria sp.]|nr:TetR/AcrR family transcriptional regulator [Neisseria sp.]
MAKENKQNTFERIIDASLQLFNEEGERNISTNHIAAHLSISPGNLYYHFRNKEAIIVLLYRRYGSEIMAWLENAPLPRNMQDTADYLSGIFDIMWKYRFLFSDMNSLLSRSAELVGEHNELTRAKAWPLMLRHLAELDKNGVLQIPDQEELQDLCLNLWMTTKYWFDFERSLRGRGRQEEGAKYLGVQRNLSLIRPYVSAEHRAALKEINRILKQSESPV